MADYTRTKLSTIRHDNPVGDFIAWDEARQGAEAHSARLRADVFKKMSARDATIFKKMHHGQRLEVNGYIYDSQ